ncbi:MAG: glycosyltransferase [Planctomycetes bacterium]|nr:glycosyltransferase [Planctomycetota bacterium]
MTVFAVVLIVRDEERALGAALASLGDVPDVVVCDTGSTDGTMDVARAAGARVCQFTWCDDFAAARSYAEAQARHDWIVRFDADERLRVDATELRSTWLATEVASAERQGADRLFVRRRYHATNLHWFPRCHRRSAFRWKYPVHELLDPLPSRTGHDLAARGAVVEHEREDRPRRYRAILERALQQAPADPHLLYYLGATCFEEGDLMAAEEWLTRYLAGQPGYRYHRSEALLMRGRCREGRSDAVAAFEDYEAAAAIGPRAEPLLFAARLALARGDREQCAELVRRGRATPMPPERQPFGEWDHPYLLDRAAYDPSTWERCLDAARPPVPGRSEPTG